MPQASLQQNQQMIGIQRLKLKTKAQLESFFCFFFLTRLPESLVSQVDKIIEDTEGQRKVKSTSHLQRINWFSNPSAIAHNLGDDTG